MLVQIYEVSSPEEARTLGELGVDHIGVLVGDGSFPREQPLERCTPHIFGRVAIVQGGGAVALRRHKAYRAYRFRAETSDPASWRGERSAHAGGGAAT